MITRLLRIAALVSMAVPACAAGANPTRTIEISMGDVINEKVITRDITLAVGDTLKVSLGANHTTPYSWTAEMQIGEPSILQQTKHEYVAPKSSPGFVGAPGAEIWTFAALKAGATTVATEYVMSASPTPRCAFTANVNVL
jgi:inhibitor of cysteine peptidase